MGGTYHFVCHECPEEGVYSDRNEALAVRDDHVDHTGHRVSMSNISSPVA